MGRRFLVCAALGAAICLGAEGAVAQALSYRGASMPLRSSGSADGTAWKLDDNGYVGAYFVVGTSGPVTVTLHASGAAAVGVNPKMNVVVADSEASFDVTPGTNEYTHTFDNLPAGTYFVRTELANDPGQTARALTIDDLTIDGTIGAPRGGDSAALAVANSYIENFRKGGVHLQLPGAAAGAPVHVELANHAFKFGTAVGTSGQFVSANPNATGQKYQAFLKSHFNMIVPGNSGKWASTEFIRDAPSMNGVNNMIAFAQRNGIAFRQHNMIWGDDGGNPGWVNTLMADATAGSATAKQELLDEIIERIGYYVGDGVGTDPASSYYELDVLNEGVHQPQPMQIFGAAGMADIFNRVAEAAASAGNPNMKQYVNEYNILQNGDDAYGNWFREHAESIEAAGGRVDGFGAQYYAAFGQTGSGAHSPSRIFQTLQNLSVDDKTFLLSEFGASTASTSLTAVAQGLDDTMRLVFGSASADAFNMWGFWANDIWTQAPRAALVDANWNLTPVGVRYEQLMSQWDTDLALNVGADGSIDFRGFYGDYNITVGGKTYRMSLEKGTENYSITVVPEPATAVLALLAMAAVRRRRA